MSNYLKIIVSTLLGMSTVFFSVSPTQAQNKPDAKVLKDCEEINQTYDYASYSLYMKAPLSRNRDLARQEIEKKLVAPSAVLIDCGKIDQKTWKMMKNDYISEIILANAELKRIVTQYKLLPLVNLTCLKNGKIKKIQSTNPKCPKGYKELYKDS